MTKLGEQITKISEQSTRLSRGFAEKRAQIADYGGRHNLLKKVGLWLLGKSLDWTSYPCFTPAPIHF